MLRLRQAVLKAAVRASRQGRWARQAPEGSTSASPTETPKDAARAEKLSRDEVERLREEAEQADRVWKMAAPERQWQWHSPATIVMLVIIITLQTRLYFMHGGTLPDEDPAEKKRREETKGWE